MASVTVEAVRCFKDLVASVERKRGERWEVSAERLASLNSTRYGVLVREVGEATAPEPKPKQAVRVKGRPTKAQLLAYAEELGIEVPEGATNPEIAKLIEEAR